jgi:hypothetical protein
MIGKSGQRRTQSALIRQSEATFLDSTKKGQPEEQKPAPN